jgi:hypothetical protein
LEIHVFVATVTGIMRKLNGEKRSMDDLVNLIEDEERKPDNGGRINPADPT